MTNCYIFTGGKQICISNPNMLPGFQINEPSYLLDYQTTVSHATPSQIPL